MSHVPATQLIAQKVEMLILERDEHLSKAAAIDAKLTAVAQQLGVLPGELGGIGKPRLAPADKRSTDTMSSAMLEILYNAEKGYTRLELRDAVAAMDERFAQQLRGNINSFYNNVVRYLKSGKIVEIDAMLYHPARAPSPVESGSKLGENVTLFTGKRLGDAD